MSVIYVAGKYRSKHWWGKWLNIWRARQKGKELAHQGYTIIVPHMNSAFMDGIHNDQFWLDASMELLSRLDPKQDAIYMMKGWTGSQGACMEHIGAKRMGLLVIYEH